MVKLKVKIIWNEPRREWLLLDSNGFFITDINDCKNFTRLFPDLSRDKENQYVLTIEKEDSLEAL